MKKVKFLSIFLSIAAFLLFSQNVYAAGSIYLNPATGQITQNGETIDIVIDSGGIGIDGVEVTVEYEGDISFAGFASGDIDGCSVDGLEREAYDDIFLYCFIMTNPYTGSQGVFASLDFIATGEGGAQITITSAVVGLDPIDIGPSGNYTTTTTTTTITPIQTETTTTTTTSTALPQASLSNTTLFGIGSFFLIFSLFFFSSEISLKKREIMMKKLRE